LFEFFEKFDTSPLGSVRRGCATLNTDLITAFAMGALLLATISIYAVVAFSVSLRTKEIAIRMALGCSSSSRV